MWWEDESKGEVVGRISDPSGCNSYVSSEDIGWSKWDLTTGHYMSGTLAPRPPRPVPPRPTRPRCGCTHSASPPGNARSLCIDKYVFDPTSTTRHPELVVSTRVAGEFVEMQARFAARACCCLTRANHCSEPKPAGFVHRPLRRRARRATRTHRRAVTAH